MGQKPKKLYKIGHLTALLGVTPRTIRYYDQFGLLPHVKRSEGNVRLFDDEDIEIIKKVRYFQKSEYLPLEVIRERLYGDKKTYEKDCAIVTDSLVILTPDQHNAFPVEFVSTTLLDKSDENSKSLPKLAKFRSEDFEKKYLALYKKGCNSILSIHSSAHVSNAYDCAKKAANKVSSKIKVTLIDTVGVGNAVGLFIKHITDQLNDNISEEQLTVLISKMTPLVFSIIGLNSFSSFSLPEDTFFNSIHQQALIQSHGIKSTYIIDKDHRTPTITNVFLEKEKMLDSLIDRLEEEFISRGRYANYIMINYYQLYSEAMKMANEIKTRLPSVMIYIERDEFILPQLLGTESISISLI